MIRLERLPLLFLGMCCLLAGLWAGLARIGWNFSPANVAAHHGALMVGGFLGTLICLEKVIPLKNRIWLGLPLISGSSIVWFVVGQPDVAVFLIAFSSAMLLAVFLLYLKDHPGLIYILMAAGAACWLTGNILLLSSRFYPLAFPWWAAFILFIIVSERLELTKFLPVPRLARIALTLFLGFFAVGIITSFHGAGKFFSGLSLVAIAAWLMRYDVVGLTIKKHGLQRFVGVALLSGYFALMLSGVFLLTFSGDWLSYDATVHSFFIGFSFSMIFAHGPMILPGVLGVSAKPFHRILYGWLFVLHLSWIIRVVADVQLLMEIRRISGMMSAFAIAGYFVTMGFILVRARNARLL